MDINSQEIRWNALYIVIETTDNYSNIHKLLHTPEPLQNSDALFMVLNLLLWFHTSSACRLTRPGGKSLK